MSTLPNSQLTSQSPEHFAAHLRRRAEEAASVSVHHASLSQQYLTLSQKFAALAEQASGNLSGIARSVSQLEQEMATGNPAGPIGWPQKATESEPGSIPLTQPFQSVSPPGSNERLANGDTFRTDPAHSVGQTGSAELRSSAENVSTPVSPLSTDSENGAAAGSESESGGGSTAASPSVVGDTATGSPGADLVGPGSSAEAVGGSVPKSNPRPHRGKRSRLSLRKVIERARMVALEHAERVRVKAKKSDLKPQLRKTSEELKEELKRSRRPAAISTFVTILALLILALKQLEYVEEIAMPPLVAGFSDSIQPVEESLPVEPPAEEVGEQLEEMTEDRVEEMPEEPEPVVENESESDPEPDSQPVEESSSESEAVAESLPETENGTVPTDPSAAIGADAGSIENRSDAGRRMMVEKYGGSAASESAVGYSLEWLAARQRANGTWDFIDVGPCKNAGTVNNPIGGTAYALLPFLAAGQTHKEGLYRRQVQAGLEFLMSVGVRTPAGYDLRGVLNKADDDEDPNYAYYVHGAATLALSEAYGMTKDRKLRPYVEEAIKFLVNSQDPRGGGWRYNPQQAGSTSATTIQLMALKAAEKAGIRIPEAVFNGVTFYLDSVSIDGEGRYGYEVEKKSYAASVTAMAMLNRMYLGWGREDGDLRAGVALIDKKGPYDNLYYNYFATQVMKNWGGVEWDRWNGRLRDDLITWQSADGDAKGSWAPRDRDDYSKAGGRLLTTCLATLTLEVYYRYKPLLPDQTTAAPSLGPPDTSDASASSKSKKE